MAHYIEQGIIEQTKSPMQSPSSAAEVDGESNNAVAGVPSAGGSDGKQSSSSAVRARTRCSSSTASTSSQLKLMLGSNFEVGEKIGFGELRLG
ncbi:casein kinase I-like [Daphnia pulex]|uniref:casein kinase I-like n=1 Tax=Daphnia pulex TaxID=6669 RepID=UPI001EDECDF9|nr:casein kinase I-like [Daphnia pulex]